MIFAVAKEKVMGKAMELQVKGLSAFKSLLRDERGSEFNDGGSTNWIRNVAIGFVIAGILLALVKTFAPELVNAWKAKILEFFN